MKDLNIWVAAWLPVHEQCGTGSDGLVDPNICVMHKRVCFMVLGQWIGKAQTETWSVEFVALYISRVLGGFMIPSSAWVLDDSWMHETHTMSFDPSRLLGLHGLLGVVIAFLPDRPGKPPLTWEASVILCPELESLTVANCENPPHRLASGRGFWLAGNRK